MLALRRLVQEPRVREAQKRPGALGRELDCDNRLGPLGTRRSGEPGQLDETVVNMAAVMKKAATIHGNEPHGIEQLTSVKIYLRDRGDLDRVRERLDAHLAPGVSTLWVEADICRRDLLLEIEGIADIPK